MILSKQHKSQSCLVEQSLYQQLISDIQSLSETCKKTLNYFYDAFSRGAYPSLAQYSPISKHEEQSLVSVDSYQGLVTGCFGCYCQIEGEHGLSTKKSTEHLVEWSTGKVYAWCIWDAFFIAKILAKPATIVTKDPISLQSIQVDFDGVKFSSSDLWFSFPLGELQTTGAIRACFCCRTKAFTSLSAAQIFAKAQNCEVVDMAQMLTRTDQMSDALRVV